MTTPPSGRSDGRMVALAGGLALALTMVPWLTAFNFPFRLLVTIVHELSHGLMALLTGGTFVRFVVFPDGSGLAYTAGGVRLLIVPAGYLGSALFGAALVLLGRRPERARLTIYVLGVVLPLLALRYGAPSLLSSEWVAALLTVIGGVALGAAFLLLARRAAVGWVTLLLYLVAFQSTLLACTDLLTLIGLTTSISQAQSNDVQTMAQLTLVPAVIWALLWAVCALGLIGLAFWRVWQRRS
jgi:Peptidase M50B-like